MIYPAIDKLLNIVSSKYQLVHVAAMRSREIARTNHLQKAEGKYESKKNIGRALEEVEEGLLKVNESK